MRYALIADGVVVNVILWDGTAPYDEGALALMKCPPEVGIGWAYSNGAWTPPTEQAPAH